MRLDDPYSHVSNFLYMLVYDANLQSKFRFFLRAYQFCCWLNFEYLMKIAVRKKNEWNSAQMETPLINLFGDCPDASYAVVMVLLIRY